MTDREQYEMLVIETAIYIQELIDKHKLPNLPEVRKALVEMYQKGVEDMHDISKQVVLETMNESVN